MAAYMEFSFTGEAARDRYYGDHSSHTLITGGAGSGIPRALNITPSSATTPSGTKRSFAVGMWAVAPQERVRCCSGDAVDLVDKVGPPSNSPKPRRTITPRHLLAGNSPGDGCDQHCVASQRFAP